MSATATSAGAPAGFFVRNDFVLRRVHSLLGIVPLALFMLEHTFTNAKAAQGPEAYHGAIEFLTGLPALYVIEVFFIFLPLYFHGLYGVLIWWTGKSNLGRYGQYTANWRYTLQRWSGLFVLLFVTYHLLHWRFGLQFPWQTADGGFAWTHYSTLTGDANSFFAAMSREFRNGPMFAFYTLGLAATMYHLANGLWSFAIVWGLTKTRPAQKRWGWFCAIVGVALFAAGVWSLVGFVTDGPLGVIQPIHQAVPLQG
jgi:succinate dehydrogenase / fumarate reductase cytochrome b subunit